MQFKKHISLLLVFFLLVSNSGLAFTVHFCGGKLASISSEFSSEKICKMPEKVIEKSCCAKSQPTHKKCCSDKKINLKTKTEKITVKTIVLNSSSVLFLNNTKSFTFVAVPNTVSSQVNLFSCDANAPPLYLLYSQFTFYA